MTIAAHSIISGAAAQTIGVIGRCIYCGRSNYADADPNRKLGIEHIVPLNIGGNLLLAEASCHACERETSCIESHCSDRIFANARPHLGFRGRKSGKVAKNIKVGVAGNGIAAIPAFLSLPEHPGHLFTFNLDVMPRILLISSVAGGGSVGSGFLAAGFGTLAPTPIGAGDWDTIAEGAVDSGVVGGIGSVLGGGKFANGAITGAFGYLFNDCLHVQQACWSTKTEAVQTLENQLRAMGYSEEQIIQKNPPPPAPNLNNLNCNAGGCHF